MPIAKQRLQCPFCSTISTRGTGLSSHIRTQHAGQYKKWNRNPDRLVQAAAKAPEPTPEKQKTRKARPAAPPPAVDVTPQHPVEDSRALSAAEPQPMTSNGNTAKVLLQKAHDDLVARKQSIEAETARIEVLKRELEVIATQLAAIDQAMSAFA